MLLVSYSTWLENHHNLESNNELYWAAEHLPDQLQDLAALKAGGESTANIAD
ncbi:hypothetical protein [Acaryochloris marina]|uniref:hypothetical protein n=1 Tax=Acaryochloris marina TaxID=155978 RepID=UPI0020182B5C|nr:hypothetical protein [Acaryochloris marina]